MGLDKGKMSDRTQFSVFSVHPVSRCRELVCTPTTRLSQRICLYSNPNPRCPGPRHCHFACKISISAGTSCFTWAGCHISGTSMATLRVRLRQKYHQGSEMLVDGRADACSTNTSSPSHDIIVTGFWAAIFCFSHISASLTTHIHAAILVVKS